jgi:hypothetical protein
VAFTFLPDGRVMAVVTSGGTVWQASSSRQEPEAYWPGWSSLGRPGGARALAVDAATNSDSRVELAALGEAGGSATSPTMEGNLWHRWQTEPGAVPRTGNRRRRELFVVMRATGKLYELSAPALGQLPSVGRSWPHP